MVKTTISITIDEEVYYAARKKGVNISQVCNIAISELITLSDVVLRCDKCLLEAPRSAWVKWSFTCPKCSGIKTRMVGKDGNIRDYTEEIEMLNP